MLVELLINGHNDIAFTSLTSRAFGGQPHDRHTAVTTVQHLM